MLRGRFGNTTGRPYIEGRLSLPRLKIAGDISFIVDTGADKTVLMPLDANRLGIDYGKLGNTVDTVGIGGYSKDYAEQAILAFLEPNKFLYVYSVKIHISTPSPEIVNIPSLLGRDVLCKWAVNFDQPSNDLTAKVIMADVQIPISTSRPPRKKP